MWIVGSTVKRAQMSRTGSGSGVIGGWQRGIIFECPVRCSVQACAYLLSMGRLIMLPKAARLSVGGLHHLQDSDLGRLAPAFQEPRYACSYLGSSYLSRCHCNNDTPIRIRAINDTAPQSGSYTDSPVQLVECQARSSYATRYLIDYILTA